MIPDAPYERQHSRFPDTTEIPVRSTTVTESSACPAGGIDALHPFLQIVICGLIGTLCGLAWAALL